MGVCNSKATGAQTQPGPVKNTATAAQKTNTPVTNNNNTKKPEEDVSIYLFL